MNTTTLASQARIIEHIFERAAERLGDITDAVIARTYAKYPDVKDAFEYQSVWNIAALEARMVEETLLCVMNWLEKPAEARLVLQDTIPHHVEVFDISLTHFYSIFDGLFDVIGDIIPPEDLLHLQVWNSLRKEIEAYIHSDAVF